MSGHHSQAGALKNHSISERFFEPIACPSDRSTRFVRWWFYPAVVVVMGGGYGAVMGSWDVSGEGRWLLVPFAAIKVPLLILCTTAICLPGYFVLATVLGVRGDFPASLAAIAAGQATLTTALASRAPITRFVYVCGVTHQQALMLSAGMFAIATVAATVVMLGRFRPLIIANKRNRVCLWAWIVMYVFVGIQSGWMLRPFVGSPGLAVSFFREGAFSNAYIAVARIAEGAWHGHRRSSPPDSVRPASE